MDKKATDWDRVSLEKHEVIYCRGIAKKLLKTGDISLKSLKRLAKSYLKISFEIQLR